MKLPNVNKLKTSPLTTVIANWWRYEAHPQSKFPCGHLQKQNTILWKYLFMAADTASVQLFFNIFATGIETFVIP
jgi:hypothetical protein